MGFEVIERTNASKRDMILAVDEFARRLRDAEIGVFYFAGHGMQIHGRNYLIPVKAHVTSETDVQFEAMDAGNKLNIVILDACRGQPFQAQLPDGNCGSGPDGCAEREHHRLCHSPWFCGCGRELGETACTRNTC